MDRVAAPRGAYAGSPPPLLPPKSIACVTAGDSGSACQMRRLLRRRGRAGRGRKGKKGKGCVLRRLSGSPGPPAGRSGRPPRGDPAAEALQPAVCCLTIAEAAGEEAVPLGGGPFRARTVAERARIFFSGAARGPPQPHDSGWSIGRARPGTPGHARPEAFSGSQQTSDLPCPREKREERSHEVTGCAAAERQEARPAGRAGVGVAGGARGPPADLLRRGEAGAPGNYVNCVVPPANRASRAP